MGQPGTSRHRYGGAMGRFDARSAHARWCSQAQRVDLDYYDGFYGPEATLRTHRNHLAQWHTAPKR